MDGSRTIRVVKRDGTEEPLDVPKLAGSMLRAMPSPAGGLFNSCQLAVAIGIYLDRSGQSVTTSAAIFEMAVKVLRQAGYAAAGAAMEAYQQRRREGRERLRVRHEGGRVTLWDKSWLSQLAQRSWLLSPTTGRILAGVVERELLAAGVSVISRLEAMDRLNARVAEYGLADAVPVRLPGRA